jgi:hypothetical protein
MIHIPGRYIVTVASLEHYSNRGAAQGCCGGDALDGYIGRKGQPQMGTITSERKSRWQPRQLAAKNLTVDSTEVQPVAELSVT